MSDRGSDYNSMHRGVEGFVPTELLKEIRTSGKAGLARLYRRQLLREIRERFQQRRLDEIEQTARDRHRNLINLFRFNETQHENGIIDFDHRFDPAIESTDIDLVIDYVKFILRRRRNKNDGFVIKLIGVKRRADGAVVLEQLLNSRGVILIRNAQDAYDFLTRKVESFTSDGLYTFSIDIVKVRIIPANRGGCNLNKHDKILKLEKFKLKSRVVKNNNCFFVCIKKFLRLKRITKKPCNIIRDKLQIEHNSPINVSEGIKLFKLCRKNKKCQLRIIDNDTGIIEETKKFESADESNRITLFLMDAHYWEVVSQERKCSICFKKWKIKHKCISTIYAKCRKCGHFHASTKECNPNHVTFYQTKILKSKNRYLLGYTKEEELDNDSVVHYDLETHPRVNKTHMPYIAGYCFGNNEFKYFTGKDCCEKFVDKLIEYADSQYKLLPVKTPRELKIAKIKCEVEELDASSSSEPTNKSKYIKKLEPASSCVNRSGEKLIYKYYKKEKKNIYLNAFNGANFDHYFLLKVFMKLGYEIKDFVLKGGSIFKARFKNIIFMDIKKHTTGSYKDNLKTMGCKLEKGDFNHSNGDDWEKMSEKDKKDCLDYLKIDVMGLKELYNKMNTALHRQYKVNMHSFFSTSHTTFTLWRRHLNSESPTLIKIPNIKEESVFRPACFGGRCYPSKKSFESVDRLDYLKGKIDYDEVIDYLVDLDVVSLYPSVMQLYDYPIGEIQELRVADLEKFNRSIRENKKCLHMGIYYIKYITNKFLSHAVLPHRTPQGLKWTLEDSHGYFTSIDIDNAIEYGYEIKIIKPPVHQPCAFYWEKSKKIYKTYIEELFKKKKKAERGSPERALAKLFMNGLYGKMIQRPITNKSIWTQNISDFWKFYKINKIEDIEVINNYMYLTGRSRDEAENEECINKPTQLGAFILGYTRRLMLKYYSESNPYFDISMYKDLSDFKKYQKLQIKNDFYYTDTDAIQVHHDNLMPLSKELGGIDDDLQEYTCTQSINGVETPGSTKIMRGIWIAPKLYMLEFITSDSCNKINKKDKELVNKGQCDIRIIGDKKFYYTYRGKGVPTDNLNVEAFEKMKDGKIINGVKNYTFSTQRDFQMKKNNVRLNKPQLEAKIDYFSITHLTGKETERILNKKPWNGREWKVSGSIPLR